MHDARTGPSCLRRWYIHTVKRDFLEILAERVVVFDGAMGTRLYELGVFLNRCFDELNISNASLVESVHRMLRGVAGAAL